MTKNLIASLAWSAINRCFLGGAIALAALTVTVSHAAVVNITSSAGDTVFYDTDYDTIYGDAGGAVVVAPHPAWQLPANVMPNLGAQWISYADTGYGGSVLAPFKDSCNAGTAGAAGCDPLMAVQESFSLTGGGVLNLLAWADDTIDVYLNGTQLLFANFTQGTCANGSPSCEPSEFGQINEVLGAGNYTLTFFVYQIGEGTNTISNPFGLLYSGTVTDVPEPASLALVGLGLLGLGVARRRRQS